MEALKIKSTGAGPSRLAYIGSVVDVIKAHLPENLADKRFSAADFAAAFELGTPQNKHSLGECVVLNGQCYTTSTDKNSSDYYKMIHGDTFMTSGIFILPKNNKPTHQINQTFLKSCDILALYEQIYSTVKQAFAFVGTVTFENLHSTAICKAPIDGNNIFEHKAEYYAKPERREKNTKAFIMGVMTDFAQTEQSEVNQELEVVLYRNPFDVSQALTHHAHILTLKSTAKKWQDITPKDADCSLHLFADGSSVKEINIDIFVISGLDDFSEKNIKK